MGDAAAAPLGDDVGPALIGVVAVLVGALMVEDLPDLRERLERRLDGDGFEPDLSLTARLSLLVEHVRWSIGERPPGGVAP